MNPHNQVQVGNMIYRPMLTADRIGYPDSEEDLSQILHTFNYTEILITLARINLLLQSREDFFISERCLQENFCSPIWMNAICASRELRGNIIFSRKSTLCLLDKSARISDPYSTRVPDTTNDARKALARCYLIANGLLEAEPPDFGTDLTEEERNGLLAALIPDLEYRIDSSLGPHVKRSMVRSKELLEGLQGCSSFDVNEIFSQATGLSLQDYQYLILSILSVASSLSLEEIVEGSELFVDTQSSPVLAPLYNRLLQHAGISINELASEMETTSSSPGEFLLWRKYPLVKVDENRIMCIDLGFLLEKLETGVFWIIRDQLEKERKGGGKKIISLRGKVFEDYVASIIKRALSDTKACAERYIIRPIYAQRRQAECTDIAVYGGDTLILLECKAPLLSAKTKFSGNFCNLHDGIKPNAIKGVEQLWSAIQALGHTDTTQRRQVEGIDIAQVRKIYPVLVLSDHMFSFPFMNRFLDSEFKRFVTCNDLEEHLEIMPLTVLTIEDLENLEPYLSDAPFHVHLYRWITQIFLDNPSFPFNEYLRRLGEGGMRQNTYMEQEVRRMHTDIEDYFLARGVN